jgi:Zn-finger nucleic acid-binding protein
MAEPTCPRCRDHPQLLAGFGALQEDVCPRCGGRYLPPDGVERVVVEENGISRDVLREMVALFLSKERIPCPACSTRMSPVHLRGTRVDLCTGCGGAWLDAGELRKLSEGRHDEVVPSALASSPAAQPPAPERAPGMDEPVSVFFSSLEPVPSAVLEAAFAPIPSLTAIDAQMLGRQHSGVVVAEIARAEAEALVASLAAAGVTAHVADVTWIELPFANTGSAFEPSAAGLRFGRGEMALDVRWPDLVAVVAGAIKRSASRNAQGGGITDSLLSEGNRAERDLAASLEIEDLVMDVIAKDPIRRVRVTLSTVLLGEGGRGRDRVVVFRERVAQVARFAGAATAVGRGVKDAVEGTRLRRYRSQTDLDRELSWLLWKTHGPGASS